MKGKLEDGTPVDIEKPGAMLNGEGKWFEFGIYRKPTDGEIYTDCDAMSLYTKCKSVMTSAGWIASEIPRATPEQLREIRMKERDGRPVKITPENYRDIIWTGNADSSFTGYVSGYKENIGKYCFVLAPDVQKEKPCLTCSKINCHFSSAADREWYKLTGCEKGWTPIEQPPQPEEPRFTVGEILKTIDDEPELPGKMPEIMETYTLENALRAVVRATKRGIRERVIAFTERRRDEGKM
jgi:predicted Rdx family selenoprotein